ncbi:MAG TPA: hypothetical protein PLJ27_18020 [Polyangiaceae bacterium]|nr:MAG: hypothetical protein BWY17_04649 [Deltaproteobacteria bacterium ADurb.Bin207]HPY19943.1 hypothetical protein [Polyangiaceae bacterium]HQK19364.1 hypothetical protein [Polyangiaceae bacterium]HQM12399.1 hypothetical protein [Polyangiaceae bacterium]
MRGNSGLIPSADMASWGHRTARFCARLLEYSFWMGLLLSTHGGWVLAEEPVPEKANKHQDAAIAESLFLQGRQAAEELRWEEACAKFEASLRLVRTLGSLANLAWCHENRGKSASAWAVYRDLLSAAHDKGDTKRENFALQRLQDLEPRLARIQIIVNHSPEGLQVRFGDQVLAEGAWNCAIPVDPGSLHLRAEAPGYISQDWTVEVPDGVRIIETEVPMLRRVVTPPVKARETEATKEVSTETGDDTLAYIFAATAVAGLGVGAYSGIMTLVKKAEGDELCTGRYCSEEGLEAHESSKRYANVATISIGAALLLGGGSVWLFASGSQDPARSASVSTNNGYYFQVGTVF